MDFFFHTIFYYTCLSNINLSTHTYILLNFFSLFNFFESSSVTKIITLTATRTATLKTRRTSGEPL